MAPITTQLISQLTERQPLRRATYVHVSALISAYNIDYIQLEREMARVNAKRSKLRTSGADTPTTSDVIETGKADQPFTSGVIDGGTMKSSHDNGDDKSDGVLAPHEDAALEGPIIPQKRLHPPRGGFNLCV